MRAQAWAMAEVAPKTTIRFTEASDPGPIPYPQCGGEGQHGEPLVRFGACPDGGSIRRTCGGGDGGVGAIRRKSGWGRGDQAVRACAPSSTRRTRRQKLEEKRGST